MFRFQSGLTKPSVPFFNYLNPIQSSLDQISDTDMVNLKSYTFYMEFDRLISKSDWIDFLSNPNHQSSNSLNLIKSNNLEIKMKSFDLIINYDLFEIGFGFVRQFTSSSIQSELKLKNPKLNNLNTPKICANLDSFRLFWFFVPASLEYKMKICYYNFKLLFDFGHYLFAIVL